MDVDSDAVTDIHQTAHLYVKTKDTESSTRQTWQRSACRVEFVPLLIATGNRESVFCVSGRELNIQFAVVPSVAIPQVSVEDMHSFARF